MKYLNVLTVSPLLVLFSFSQPVYGDLSWTGAGDAVSLYQEANWLDDNGAVPGADEVNAAAPVSAATGGIIQIDSGIGSPSNFNGTFDIGVNKLIVGGGKTLASGGSGVRGVSRAGSELTILDTSTVDVQFVLDLTITLGSGSTIELNGSNIPLNASTINVLDTASMIQFNNETWTDFSNEHLGKVTFNGSPLAFGADPFTQEAGDNLLALPHNVPNGVKITFLVPEPASTTGICFMALGAFLLRRSRINR